MLNPNAPKQNIFKLGFKYMNVFPTDKRFSAYFPEIRIIEFTKLAARFMPPIATLILLLQYFLHADLGLAIVMFFVICSLPFQGLIWLGFRARSPLPLHLIALLEKMLAALELPLADTSTYYNYLTFAQIFNQTYQKFGYDFFNDDKQNKSA